MGFFGDLGDSALEGLKGGLGLVEKAVIVIHDRENTKASDVPEKKKKENNTSSSTGGLPASGGSGGLPGATSVEDMASKNKKKKKPDGRKFQVQFNPAEISLDGFAGGLYSKQDYSSGGAGSSLSLGAASLSITMRFRLVFDTVKVSSAFGAPVMNVSGLVQRVGSKIKEGRQGINSVQAPVETLVSALRNPATRLVSFCWGEKIQYTGVVNRVDVNYSMFDKYGRPIRAYVDVSMLLANEEAEAAKQHYEKYWIEKYEKAFGDKDPVTGKIKGKDVSMVSVSQKAGSFLNI